MPYPFAKLDQIAVPDFEAGAMENAGVVLYRNGALLLDEKDAPALGAGEEAFLGPRQRLAVDILLEQPVLEHER